MAEGEEFRIGGIKEFFIEPGRGHGIGQGVVIQIMLRDPVVLLPEERRGAKE